MSLRLRVTLLTCGVVALVLLVVASVFFLTVGARLRADLDSRVARRAQLIDAVLLRHSPVQPFRTERPATGDRTDPVSMFSVFHGAGVDQADVSTDAPAGLRIPDQAWAAAPAATAAPRVLSLDSGGQEYRVAVLRLPGLTAVYPAGQRVEVDAVAVGTSLTAVQTTLRSLAQVVVVAVVAGLLVTGLGAWLAAGRGLGPIVALSRAVGDVGRGGDLSRRVPVGGAHDEVTELATSFNLSLDRVQATYEEMERLLEQQQRFVADASHELRTPLTTIRTDIEVVRRHPGLPTAVRDRVLDNALTEMRRLSELVSDLLTLASADARTAVVPTAVSWDEMVQSAADEARRICAPRPVSLSVSGPLGPGLADQDALQRIFVALFENIAHHTPSTTRVWVCAGDGEGSGVAGDAIEVRVEDDGPGVAPEHLPHLFERFFQADASRHSRGTGLGLAIARSLVEAHGGRISAGPGRHRGLEVVLTLPRTAGTGAGGPTEGSEPSAAGSGPPPPEPAAAEPGAAETAAPPSPAALSRR
jgi:two-component system, OmpR family, sensor kinase